MDRSCLDASHESWDIPHLFVDMCTDPNDPIVRTTDLTQFFNSDDPTGHYQVEYDVKLYFPSFVKPTATKLSDVNTSSSVSVADYLNNSSCIDNGYCLRTNGLQSYSSSTQFLKLVLSCKRYSRSKCTHNTSSLSTRASYAPSGKKVYL